jgi:predicted secreted hydrolase
MTRRSALVVLLLVLCGCSSSQPARLAQAPHRVVASVGSDRLQAVKRTQAKSEKPKPVDRSREAELASLPKHSPEWWAVRNAIEAEEDAKLAKILVICKGCFDPVRDDHTGSIE